MFANNPCDLAVWCKLLRDKGWTGPQIARSLGRSEGYVNNLIRIVERGSPGLLLRWHAEHAPSAKLRHVCATDWLVQVVLLTHAEQDAALDARLERLARRPVVDERDA